MNLARAAPDKRSKPREDRMPHMAPFAPFFVVLALSGPLPAAAPPASEDLAACRTEEPTAQVFAACGRLIASAGTDKLERAEAYARRGNLLRDRADFAAAVTDYDAALRLSPDMPAALNGRGVAY